MDGFKQRIIGALVLISLAVIFVPMLLDEPHEERATRTIEIPQEPEFPEVRIEEAQAPEPTDAIEPVPAPDKPPLQTSDTDPVQETAPMTASEPVRSPPPTADEPGVAVDPPQPVAPAPAAEVNAAGEEPVAEPVKKSVPEPTPEPAPAAGGYVIQLASFGNKENAQDLKGSVEEAGFASHTTTIDRGGKTFTRVFAGPFPDKEAAVAAKKKLDSRFGLNTLVMVND